MNNQKQQKNKDIEQKRKQKGGIKISMGNIGYIIKRHERKN